MADLLTCDGCQQVKTKLLPCKHSHCLSCLEKNSETVEKIKCVVCGEVHARPQNLDSLPDNNFITTFEKIKQKYEVKMIGNNYCDTCGDGQKVAEKYCAHCRQHLCLSCLQMHNKFKMNQKHEVVDVNVDSSSYNEAIKKVDYEKCLTHDQNIDIYCQDCNQFICLKCFIFQHKEHKFTEISSKVEEDKKKIESTIAELQKNLVIYDEKLEIFEETSVKSEIISKICSNGNALKVFIDNFIKDFVDLTEKLFQMYHGELIKESKLEICNEKKIIEARISSLIETMNDLNFQTVIHKKYDLCVTKCKTFYIQYPFIEFREPSTLLYYNLLDYVAYGFLPLVAEMFPDKQHEKNFDSSGPNAMKNAKRISITELIGRVYIKNIYLTV
ncbi:hypothetical protein HELRODRAFT_175609 [Helobdella robusta]|uniref:B box-type domain-containing protein n=1 Tax=Helobdella robusta TaxID=6412 RepID=T1F9F3_HELRO|nr:hypothetical protein HELRODRAFT_175609 [Helobdella robusta]ESO00632.1 hypothetical protein HELRODRAFT_175609 [Helobdella robusta]